MTPSDFNKNNDAVADEVKNSIAIGKEALENHDIVKAFDYLLLPALIDGRAMKLFLMIVNTFTRLYLLTDAQVARLKEYAEKGYPLAQYAYGRYLYIVRPDRDAVGQADDYFKAAEKAGLGDAIQAQSTVMLDGHYGLVDIEEAHKMTLKSIEQHSELGARAYLRRILFGDEFLESDPQKVIDTIKKMFPYESNDIEEVNPFYYEILGDAYEKLGEKREAEIYYNKAINMGYYEAFGNYCFINNGGLDTDELKKAYLDLLAEGCEANDPSSYVYRAAYLMDNYNHDEDGKRHEITAQIKADLEAAAKLGSQLAPYFLGTSYYYGNYGFEEDNTQAWNWLIEGTMRDEGMAYAALAQMIEDGYNPNVVDDGMSSYCHLMALRLGEDDELKKVVKAYENGELTDYAAEIEKYYIPRYDALPDDDDDDDDDDDEEEEDDERIEPFDDDYYKLIAIVKTNGTADIYEFDVEEGWDELAEMVAARRLDAIRVQPLYDIAEQVGLRDHITGWVDNMGLMKNLPMNPIGCKIYPGPIAGDMILTVEDARYNPKSFASLEQLKQVVAALGANLGDVILEDGPDDDGRYDAWS